VEISRYIKDLLINRDNVIIAGFGAFEKTYSSARIDPVTGEMHPPQTTVVFRPDLKTDSGVMNKYIAEKESISEETAKDLVQNQVTEWEKALSEGQNVVLPGLGSLAKNAGGEYIFTATTDPSDFPESYGLPVISVQEKMGASVPPPIKQEEAKKTEEKKPVEKKAPVQKKPIPQAKKPISTQPKKSSAKLIIALLLGLVVVAVVVLSLIYPDIAKQKFNDATKFVGSIFKGKEKPVDTLPIPTDTLTAEDSANIETEAILENYTIVNSETNARLEPKLDQLSDAKKVYIIAGSFKVKSYANRLRNKLNKKGFRAEVLPVNNGLYRVSIGSFDDVKSAAEDFNRIRSIDQNIDVWLLINK
jgi:nucleoid DNA-binding protein